MAEVNDNNQDTTVQEDTENKSKKQKTSSEKGYEYLDHTADIQFHAWGKSLKEAFEQVVIAMFGYMVELDTVEIDSELDPIEVEVEGHDLESLLFAFMDEFLFQFSTEFYVCKTITITEFDQENFKIKATGYQDLYYAANTIRSGEKFNKKKHGSGTEIKAITYSNMQIHNDSHEANVYVIVDI